MAVDARASSLVDAVDAAIERVVAHFEENDLALRADVLRALAAQAKLAFETERVRQRLRQHPLTRDLIDAVSTRSSVFARLDAGLSVQAYSCEYDAQRNVEILATVEWLLRADDKQKQQQQKKKRKTQASGSRVDRSVPLTLRYAYSRTLTDEGATLVEFRVTSCVGAAGKPSELVHFAMTSSAPYPRSYYEDTNAELGGDDDDEEEEDKEDEEGEEEGKAVNASRGKQTRKGSGDVQVDEEDDDHTVDGHGHCSDDDCKDDHCGDDGCGCEHGDGEHSDDGPFGEAVEAFNVGESAVEEILTWMDEDGVDPADVVGFFLALPVTEDEWQLDERITEIAFGDGGSEDGDGDGDESEAEK